MEDKQEKTKRVATLKVPVSVLPPRTNEWLAEMKRKQEINRKREEVEAYWNQPLDTKDRD